jgi:translocator protein
MLNASTRASLVGIIICLFIGLMSGYFAGDANSSWFMGLEKPFFNPPNAVFGPVWSVLYVMIGVAGARLWSMRLDHQGLWYLFVGQFICNILWTPLFFAMHRIDLALLDIMLLWCLLCVFMVRSFRLGAIFWWMLPYFCWVSFALCLNCSFYLIN